MVLAHNFTGLFTLTPLVLLSCEDCVFLLVFTEAHLVLLKYKDCVFTVVVAHTNSKNTVFTAQQHEVSE